MGNTCYKSHIDIRIPLFNKTKEHKTIHLEAFEKEYPTAYKYFKDNKIIFDFEHWDHSYKGENTTLKYCVKIYFSKNKEKMTFLKLFLKLEEKKIASTCYISIEHPEFNHIMIKLNYRENIKIPYPCLKVYKK